MSRKRIRSKHDILKLSLQTMLKKIKIDHTHDVPYIAGYSKNGHKIYIDRRLPLYMPIKSSKRKTVNITKFLVLHEVVEKALITELGGIYYEYAHEIATLAEKNALRREKISTKTYDKFIKKYAERIEQEDIEFPPTDLDLKPYRDEKDYHKIYKLNLRKVAKG